VLTDVSTCSYRSQFDEAFLALSQTRSSSSSQINALRSSRTPSMDTLPSRVKSIQETPDYKPGSLLTIHELPHILGDSVDNSESMSCSILGFVSRQSVKPLEDSLDVLLLEKLLDKFDCVLLSKVKRRRERTHLIVAASVLLLPERAWR